jgi:hypothetical protein
MLCVCCSERKAGVDKLRAKLLLLLESGELVPRMKMFEKAQSWAAVDERRGKAEAVRKQLEVRRRIHPVA